MSGELVAIGATLSTILMLPVATRCRLPQVPPAEHVVAVGLGAALPCVWAYGWCETGRGVAAAIAGQVKALRRTRGRFVSLRKDEARFVNERSKRAVEGPHLTVAVVQLASRLVRSVEGCLSLGQAVSAGGWPGRNPLGSLVGAAWTGQDCVWLEAQRGDRVLAGVSVLTTRTARAEGQGQ